MKVLYENKQDVIVQLSLDELGKLKEARYEEKRGAQVLKIDTVKAANAFKSGVKLGYVRRGELKTYMIGQGLRGAVADRLLNEPQLCGGVKIGEYKRGRYYVKGTEPEVRMAANTSSCKSHACGNPSCGLRVPEGDKYCAECRGMLDEAEMVGTGRSDAMERDWASGRSRIQ